MKKTDLKKGIRVFLAVGDEPPYTENLFVELTLVNFAVDRENKNYPILTCMEFDTGRIEEFSGPLFDIYPVNERTRESTEIVITALKRINEVQKETECTKVNDWYLRGFLVKIWNNLCCARTEKRFNIICKKLNGFVNTFEKISKELDSLNVEGNYLFYQ
jgi:hypothetical protein